MSIPLIVNGVTFNYPQEFDTHWGPTLTNWSSAVTTGMLQKAGGSFPLTAEVNFGTSFGIKALYFKSTASNIAATGVLRLSNASSGIVWRNFLNNADLALTVNASNQLTFNGISIGATTSLTDGHILVGDVTNQPADVAMTGDISITDTGVTSIGTGVIINTDINASAAIALSKLAPTTAYYWYAANASGVLTPLAVTASRIVTTDTNGLPTTISSPTLTEIAYVGGVTSAIQTQIDSKVAKAGDTMSGVLNMGSHKIIAMTQGTNTGEAISYPVTTSEISATAGIVGTQLANATVTGTQIASSVALAGSPTTTTQAATDSSTKIATTAYVQSDIKFDFLATLSASNSSSLQFTGLSTSIYSKLHVVIDDVIPVSNDVLLEVQLSTGSGFLTTNYNHTTIRWTASGATTDGTDGTSVWTLNSVGDGLGNAANHKYSVELDIFNNVTALKRGVWHGIGLFANGRYEGIEGRGEVDTNSAAIDGLKFLMSSGNISTGTFTIYGLRSS